MNQPPCWIEVDLSALADNYRQICNLAGSGVVVVPVVKANAYGHGIAEVSKRLESEGAKMLAVTHLYEAQTIRDAGISADILIMTPPRGGDAYKCVELNLTPCVMDNEGADELTRAAKEQNKPVNVHLKIDTGMGRLGTRPDFVMETARHIQEKEGLNLTGVYSHCANGSNEPSVARQLRLLEDCLGLIRQVGVAKMMRHIAASAAFLSLPSSRLDAVRIGTLLYGQYPNGVLQRQYQGKELNLKNTWTFKSRIIAIRKLNPGTSIGYGSEFQTARVSRIAVIPAGFHDGLGIEPISLRRRGLIGMFQVITRPRFDLWATIRGEKVPIVGRIAMQMCCADVTDLTDVKVGDEVILPVRRLNAGGHIPRIFL